MKSYIPQGFTAELLLEIEKRLLAGKQFPTSTDLLKSGFCKNRGKTVRGYAVLEDKELIARNRYHWNSGIITPRGYEVAGVIKRYGYKTPKGRPKGTDVAGVVKKPPGTMFPQKIKSATESPLVKYGTNSKLGKEVSVGEFKGYRMGSVTLEERGSGCPRTCPTWNRCYGDNMPYAVRIKDDENLIPSVRQHKDIETPTLIRLHVLGDFISLEYIEAWADSVRENPNLAVWGFTGHDPYTKLGGRIARIAEELFPRFNIRHSGATVKDGMGSFIDDGSGINGVKCPVQTGKRKTCAECGLCFSKSRVNIIFDLH